MSKSLKVSVAVPVYNESDNIKNLILSLLSQKEISYKLLEIIVISDASSDDTVERVREIKDPRLKVIIEKRRMGQNFRLNQIFSIFKGDAVVLFEGDMVAGKSCLEELVKPFTYDKDVSLSYGVDHPVALKNSNYWTRVFSFIDNQKINELQKLKNGKNIYLACSCRALAGRFARKFRYPADIPEDSYLYLYCLKNKLKTVYRPEARCYFRSPGNLHDYLKKTDKYNKGKEKLSKYFPDKMIESAYFTPKNWLFFLLLRSLAANPVYLCGYILSLVLSKIYLMFTPQFGPLWDISASTKKLSSG